MAEVAQVEQPKDFSDDVSPVGTPNSRRTRGRSRNGTIDAKRISERYSLEDERRRGDYIDNRSSCRQCRVQHPLERTSKPRSRRSLPANRFPSSSVATATLIRLAGSQARYSNAPSSPRWKRTTFIGVFEQVTIDTLVDRSRRAVGALRGRHSEGRAGSRTSLSPSAPRPITCIGSDFAHSS